ncbi:MAG: hypothetical protein V2A78_11180 [bacterium]
MKERERRYLERIEEIIERFGSIQRDFVLDQSGIHAIVEFIENFSGSIPEFSLNDPVLLKGKQAAFKVIDKLEKQLSELESLDPPELWKQFHDTFVNSIRIQLEGYKDMVQVFTDRDIMHITRGRARVDEGVSRLEGGSRGTWLCSK